jgi:cell division GTPase FtsZ
MLGIVGIGAAGNNISDEFAKRGVQSIAINFSARDLEALEYVEEKLVLVGSEGVGKVRESATKLMENNWESAVEFVKKHMSMPSIEVIFVTFSTGGGSGSGASPLLIEMLQSEMPDKTFVSCPILPDLSEVMISQMNTLSTLEELSDLGIYTLPIDNEKTKEKYGMLPKNKLYRITNESFVELILKVTSYTEKHSKHGVLDRKDLLQIFKTNGVGVISEVNLTDISNLQLSSHDIANKIQNSWIRSMFSEINFNKISSAGIIFDGNEDFLNLINYRDIFDVFGTMPVELFEGNYFEKKHVEVISILGGLDWIHQRIKLIEDEIEHQKSNVNLDEKQPVKTLNKFKELNSKLRKNTTPKRSVSDILSKYRR